MSGETLAEQLSSWMARYYPARGLVAHPARSPAWRCRMGAKDDEITRLKSEQHRLRKAHGEELAAVQQVGDE